MGKSSIPAASPYHSCQFQGLQPICCLVGIVVYSSPFKPEEAQTHPQITFSFLVLATFEVGAFLKQLVCSNCPSGQHIGVKIRDWLRESLWTPGLFVLLGGFKRLKFCELRQQALWSESSVFFSVGYFFPGGKRTNVNTLDQT